MKKHKKIKYLLLIFLLQLCCFQFISGQTVVNNGAKIVIRDGANVIIGGNYINKNDGISDGEINLDGNIFLRKNWFNNANNEVLVSVGAGQTGNLILDGTAKQFIDGVHSSTFENLVIKNSKKVLNITDCKINDTLQLDAILDLNAHRIKILNDNPIAINYFSGYILGETNTNEGLGEVEWSVGSQKNSYTVPFGSGFDAGPDVKVSLKTITAGLPSNGSIRFATYPTDCQNSPLPPGVTSLDRGYEFILDRFWIIDPVYNSKPDIGMVFHYRSQDINHTCNNGLVEPEMKAIRYNNFLNTWTDMQPVGVSNPSQKLFVIDSLASNDFYSPWCLVSEVTNWQINFPNSFSPNGNGLNDYFAPVGENLDKLDFKMYIYNRWGGLMYIMNDINKPWDGHSGSKLCPEGVYTWIMFLKGGDGVEHMYKGIVTLLN